MKAHLIYWPVLAQVLLPILVLLVNGARKAKERKAGTIDVKAAAMNNDAWGKPVVLTSRNLANQFQLPVLFYVVAVVLALIDGVAIGALVVAWLFVVSRYAHAYVHITTNKVPVRLRLFILGALLLLGLWGWTAVALLRL